MTNVQQNLDRCRQLRCLHASQIWKTVKEFSWFCEMVLGYSETYRLHTLKRCKFSTEEIEKIIQEERAIGDKYKYLRDFEGEEAIEEYAKAFLDYYENWIRGLDGQGR